MVYVLKRAFKKEFKNIIAKAAENILNRYTHIKNVLLRMKE